MSDPTTTITVDSMRASRVRRAARIAVAAKKAMERMGEGDAEWGLARLDAVRLHTSAAALPPADHVGTLVALVRELLDSAPAACISLDRAVRNAAKLNGHAPTPAQEERAGEILRVWREVGRV